MNVGTSFRCLFVQTRAGNAYEKQPCLRSVFTNHPTTTETPFYTKPTVSNLMRGKQD